MRPPHPQPRGEAAARSGALEPSALARSEEALRRYAVALEEQTWMNETLARLVQQIEGAQAGVAEQTA